MNPLQSDFEANQTIGHLIQEHYVIMADASAYDKSQTLKLVLLG